MSLAAQQQRELAQENGRLQEESEQLLQRAEKQQQVVQYALAAFPPIFIAYVALREENIPDSTVF